MFKVAWKLTETEMPRTESQFEESYTYKVFTFQFVNFYGALFYLSFIRGNQSQYHVIVANATLTCVCVCTHMCVAGSIFFAAPPTDAMSTGCPVTGCLMDVTIQLFIIMTGKQAINNVRSHLQMIDVDVVEHNVVCWQVLEIGMPLIKNRMRKRGHQGDASNSYTRWERDLDLEEVPPINLFGDYLEMLIQFGFVTMFVPSFPLAPLFALINNVIEIRLDAFKMITATRRLV